MMQPALLSVDAVSRHFEGLKAVDQASLAVKKGTIAALIGPNGAGKTTLFNVISGLLAPSAGAITFLHARLDRMPAHRIARLGIARTFQDPRTFYEMNVLDHVVCGLRLRAENPLAALLRDPKTTADWRAGIARARALLTEVGLAGRAADKAQDLSFGEQRFLSIARALAADPVLLLLDEPTVGLDAAAIRKLKDLLVRTVREQGKTVLLIEHNMEVVFDIADQVHLMFEGSVVVSGSPAEVRRHPKMIESYLGARYAARRRAH